MTETYEIMQDTQIHGSLDIQNTAGTGLISVAPVLEEYLEKIAGLSSTTVQASIKEAIDDLMGDASGNLETLQALKDALQDSDAQNFAQVLQNLVTKAESELRGNVNSALDTLSEFADAVGFVDESGIQRLSSGDLNSKLTQAERENVASALLAVLNKALAAQSDASNALSAATTAQDNAATKATEAAAYADAAATSASDASSAKVAAVTAKDAAVAAANSISGVTAAVNSAVIAAQSAQSAASNSASAASNSQNAAANSATTATNAAAAAETAAINVQEIASGSNSVVTSLSQDVCDMRINIILPITVENGKGSVNTVIDRGWDLNKVSVIARYFRASTGKYINAVFPVIISDATVDGHNAIKVEAAVRGAQTGDKIAIQAMGQRTV